MPRDSVDSKNVLFVSSVSDFYGAEKSLLEIVRRIGPQWRPHFVVPRSGRFADAIREVGFPVDQIGLEFAGRDLRWFGKARILAQLIRFIRTRKISLVHLNLHFQAPLVSAACTVTGVPLIVHVRNMIEGPIGRRLRGVDGIICISQAVHSSLLVEGRLSPRAFRDHLWIIPDGRDILSCGQGDGKKVRREFGIDDDVPLVGMAARMTPMKGQDIFLQMAALVLQQVPSVRFLLVGSPCLSGDAEWMAYLRQLHNDLGLNGRVLFTGYRHDMPDILAAIDCFVHPSKRGAFVSVLIEAMASGVPIVASEVDGIPECVGREGAGTLLREVSASTCAEAVIKILTDPAVAKKMAVAGRSRARARFDISQLAVETASAFEAVTA